jgi:2,3-bisphosphoglycerate-independent phosphoglycerate mutase
MARNGSAPEQFAQAVENHGLSALTRKCALLIIDGLGDLPVPELGGKTPLEAAGTPVMNQLAGRGHYGLVDPIITGEIPNTHSGTGMLLGLPPDQADRLKRGPVEASGAGHVLRNGEIAMRVNFATLEERDDELYVIDRRAGRITQGTHELAELLTDIDLGDGVRGMFRSTDQHRGVLILSGPGLDEGVGDTDPKDVSLPAHLRPCRPLRAEAELTAEKIDRFLEAAGKPPANGLLTRGAGAWFSLGNSLTRHGISATVVAGCNTVRGLGRIFGFGTVFDPRFTAAFDTDLDAKMSAVVAALEDHEMVYLHVKAPDICSHDRQPSAKRDFLERLDEAMKALLPTGAIIALAADHTTDSNTGFHTADPIPALFCLPGTSHIEEEVNFGESACRNGNMERQTSEQFLLRVIQAMGY